MLDVVKVLVKISEILNKKYQRNLFTFFLSHLFSQKLLYLSYYDVELIWGKKKMIFRMLKVLHKCYLSYKHPQSVANFQMPNFVADHAWS